MSHACRHGPNDPEFKTFPPHCIRGTLGARIIPEGLALKFYTVANDAAIELPENFLSYQQIVLEKQTLDVFDNPHTSVIVERLGKDVEYAMFGVVTEYCVRLAAKGLLERGRSVSLVTDAIETLNPLEERCTIEELKSLGAKTITTSKALAAVGSPSS
jgi:nicotinamidase/pyrazinamidase